MFSLACALAVTIAAQEDRWFGEDKALHLVAGAAISAFGYELGVELDHGVTVRFIIGGSLGLAAAGGKELADLAIGDPSLADFVWSAAGAAVGLFLGWAIDRWLKAPDTPMWLRLE